MMLALLKSTAPQQNKQTQTPRARLKRPDVLWNPIKMDLNAIQQKSQGVDGTFILLSLQQAGPVQTCQHQARPRTKEQS